MSTSKYEAFISYSHAADSKLAEALEQGLQRFAKPIFKARGMHVFRDDSDLSLTPALWEDIREALSESDYFVLLASPESAVSSGVSKELNYWIDKRDVKTIFIVQTNGQIAWNDDSGDYDWTKTTCLPQELKGVFEGEPLHLDMRWARTESELNLRNDRFARSIARIVAAIRRCAVEDVYGQEIQAHRRTIRLRNSAIALLVCLAVAAVLAVRQSRDASYQFYIATLSDCEFRINEGDFETARELLETVASPPRTRFRRALELVGLKPSWRTTWEVRYLRRVLDRTVHGTTLADTRENENLGRASEPEVPYKAADSGPIVFSDSATYLPIDSSLLDLVPSGLALMRDEDSFVLVASADRRKLAAWSPTGLMVRSIDGSSFDVQGDWPQLNSEYAALGFSPDGRRLAVLGPVHEVWNISNLSQVERHRLEGAWGPLPAGGELRFDPRSETLAYGVWKSLYIWDVSSGDLLFATNEQTPKMLPGDQVSYYMRWLWALAFDDRGETIFVAYEGTTEIESVRDDDFGDDSVTVLAVGSRASDGRWSFEERLVGDFHVRSFCQGISDPERIVYLSGSDALEGLAYRSATKTFRIPIQTQPIGGQRCDVHDDRYVTVHGQGGIQTFDLKPVSDPQMLFAARQWGYCYSIPDLKVSSIGHVEATASGTGIFIFGSLEDDTPFVLEHGLLDGGFRHFDTVGTDANDLQMKRLHPLEQWWVVDVQESSDHSRLFGFVLKWRGGADPYDPNRVLYELPRPHDWDSYTEGTVAFLVSWDRKTGRQLQHWRLHPNPTLEPSAPQVRLVDVPPTPGVEPVGPIHGFVLEDPTTGEELMRSLPQWPHVVPIVSPDVKRAAFNESGTLLLQDAETGRNLLTLEKEFVVDRVTWALDGNWLVGTTVLHDRSVIQVWDTQLPGDPKAD